MAQISMSLSVEFDILLYLKQHLPAGCQMKAFEDIAIPNQATCFIYGEMVKFWELETLVRNARSKRGVILAEMI